MSISGAPGKVVILDRDGTIVLDRGYLDDPAGLEFGPTVPDALQWLYGHGYRLVVITNQSGVGRGFFTCERVEAMNIRLQSMAGELGVRFEGIYHCPHRPDAGCRCRKPALGLLVQAAADLDFDPRQAFVIGDKDSDVEFGRRAGARTILIASEVREPGTGIAPDFVAADLMQAARIVTHDE